MIESTQILLFAVVITLTVMLVIIGWQIQKILSEIYKIIAKFNTGIDQASVVAKKIGRSFESLSGFSEGVKTVLGIIHFFTKGKKKDEEGKK